jgi:hypothetical protein
MKKTLLYNLAVTTAVAVLLIAQACSNNNDEYVNVTGITVTPENMVMLVNDQVTLVAEVFPRLATDKTVRWDTDNGSVATVDQNGIVQAVSEGIANINVTANANTSKTKTCIVTVVNSFQVVLSKNTLLVPIDATRQLIAHIIPDNVNQNVNWNSDNTDVVTVDQNGNITAVATGIATITAASSIDNNRTDQCNVTVVDVGNIPDKQNLAGLWNFNDPNNLGKATVGNDLIVNGKFDPVNGPDNSNAAKPNNNAFLTVVHEIGPNGNGNYVNEYTFSFDAKATQQQFNDWLSIFNNKNNNNGDGVLWINGDGNIGYAELGGYSTTGLKPNTWHKITITAKLGNSLHAYIDGNLVWTASKNVDTDGIMSLLTDVLFIGYDGSGYAGPDIDNLMIWNTQLTEQQVLELGKP